MIRIPLKGYRQSEKHKENLKLSWIKRKEKYGLPFDNLKYRNSKPMLGKHHTEETKRKISEKLKNHSAIRYWLGKSRDEKTRQKIKEKVKEVMNKPEIKAKFSGSNHYNWRGGITPEAQKRCCMPDWKELRKLVYKRDNWTCQNCKKQGGKLIAHHKIPYRVSKDNSLNNLITLCQKCHAKIENNLIVGKI